MLFFIFFFQAEDGIRDGHVTGVQTCALPILAVEKERIDVSLQILPSGLTITGGVQKRLFVRYTVAMLAGRTLELRRALAQSYQQTTLDLITEDGVDVKTILQDLQRDQLALGGELLE